MMKKKDNVQKPIYKRWWFIAIAAIFFFALLGAITGDNESAESDNQDADASETVDEINDEEEPEENQAEELSEPVLTDDIFQEVIDFMEEDELVRDAHVGLYEEDTQIRITLQVEHATSEEQAEDLADSAIRWLASQAAQHPDNNLDSPSNEHLGELYDYYDLRVGVGTDANNFIYAAQKNTTHDSLRPASY
jgi:hypothetical protein